MAKKKAKQTTQIVAYIFSAIVVLSMVIGMVGPIVFDMRPPPTPTWLPTWTPQPTPTAGPATATPIPPTATPIPPTATPIPPTATPVPPTETAAPTSAPQATATAAEPEAGPPAPIVFAVLGDSRAGEEVYRQLLAQIVADGNAFLVHTGDMVEQGSEGNMAAFQALMANFPLPFYPVPGNHDLDGDGSAEPYLAYSGAPALHYSFDVETAHLTMADSASGILSEEELAWIDADLAATNQPVKIVFVHHPPFDPDGTAYVTAEGSEALMALMAKHGVDYVFSGDIHTYAEQERDGTVYVVTGGGGAPLYTTDHPNAFHHYVQVTVLGDQVRTQVIRLD